MTLLNWEGKSVFTQTTQFRDLMKIRKKLFIHSCMKNIKERKNGIWSRLLRFIKCTFYSRCMFDAFSKFCTCKCCEVCTERQKTVVKRFILRLVTQIYISHLKLEDGLCVFFVGGVGFCVCLCFLFLFCSVFLLGPPADRTCLKEKKMSLYC